MSLLSDQVAPAHHNHSQSYRPSYSDTTFSSGCFSGSHLNVRKGVRSPVSGRSPAPRGPPGTNLGGLRGRSRALRNVPETLPGRSQLRPSHPGRLGRGGDRAIFRDVGHPSCGRQYFYKNRQTFVCFLSFLFCFCSEVFLFHLFI